MPITINYQVIIPKDYELLSYHQHMNGVDLEKELSKEVNRRRLLKQQPK